MTQPGVPTVPTWKIVLAFVLDLITVYFLGGYLIAMFTGQLTESGFRLQGWSAILLIAVMVAYFTLSGRLLGGTFWQRILKTRRPSGIAD
jgi:hypothetical protein